MLRDQISLIDPLAKSMSKPIVQRMFRNGYLIFLEIVCWLLFLSTVALVLFLDKLFPFYYLNQLAHSSDLFNAYPPKDIQLLKWSIRILFILIGILFMIIASLIAKSRQKNTVINLAGKNMKSIAEQLLRRRAALEDLELKYPVELPKNDDGIVIEQKEKPNNDVLL
jgi:hypothetical protein